MSDHDCDLFVIGAGSGGVRASRMATAQGARVIVAEAAALGGTCVNLGCIPKKLYSHAAHYGECFAQARGFGWQLDGGPPTLDWSRLKSQRAAEITRLNGLYDQMLRQAGVTVMRGRARLEDPHTVTVRSLGGAVHTVTARHILLATGGQPRRAQGQGAEWALDSDAMFDLDPFPRRLVVVGGGYIACEFASIFHGLGAQVTLVHRSPRLLRGFDAEITDFVAAEMRKKGVVLQLGATVVAASRHAASGPQALTLSNGQQIEADAVLHATGRRPAADGLGLESLGIRLNEDGTVPVNERFQTVVPSVFALGDLVGRKALTPVALAEAMVLVDHLFGEGKRPPLDYASVATAVFTHPNIGTVGLSEEAARESGFEVRIFRSEFRALRHTLSGSTERTLMKIVVDARTDRLLGMHMVGEDAGEVIQGFAVAVQAGLTKAALDLTLGIHPTVAEEFVTMRG